MLSASLSNAIFSFPSKGVVKGLIRTWFNNLKEIEGYVTQIKYSRIYASKFNSMTWRCWKLSTRVMENNPFSSTAISYHGHFQTMLSALLWYCEYYAPKKLRFSFSTKKYGSLERDEWIGNKNDTEKSGCYCVETV
jgi:hypothetical protein